MTTRGAGNTEAAGAAASAALPLQGQAGAALCPLPPYSVFVYSLFAPDYFFLLILFNLGREDVRISGKTIHVLWNFHSKQRYFRKIKHLKWKHCFKQGKYLYCGLKVCVYSYV